MSKSTAFYYVESAPQIISAFRHIKQKNISKFDLIVRLNGNLHNDKQIQQVINDLDIEKIGHVTCHRIGAKLLFIIFMQAMFRSYTYFCIADIRSLVSLYSIIVTKCKNFVLLDDGIASISFYEKRVQNNKNMVDGGLLKKAIAKIAQIKIQNITLHTILPLLSTNNTKVEIDNFNKPYINSLKNIKIDFSLAVFIGSKVVESGVCSKAYFEKTLIRFITENHDKRLQYIAHREENLDKFLNYPNIEIIRLDRPLELEFGLTRDIPIHICGFYSAGLIHFFPYKDKIKILSYGLPLEQGNSQFHQSIKASKHLFTNLLKIDHA